MIIMLSDNMHKYQSIVYTGAVGIDKGRAAAIMSPESMAGSGIKPADRLIIVRLPGGERATFDAPRWTCKVIKK